MVEVGGRAAGSTAAAVFGWSGMVRRAVCLQREECSLGKEWGTELGKLVVASALPWHGLCHFSDLCWDVNSIHVHPRTNSVIVQSLMSPLSCFSTR